MELIRGIHNLRPEHAGCVLTIGNFDGVHRGHQAVLTKLREQAELLSLPSCVMVFEPQPLEFLRQEKRQHDSVVCVINMKTSPHWVLIGCCVLNSTERFPNSRQSNLSNRSCSVSWMCVFW